MFYRLDVNR